MIQSWPHPTRHMWFCSTQGICFPGRLSVGQA